MAIPTFTYDDELKTLYCDEGEVVVAVKGEINTRAVRFEIPADLDASGGKTLGDLTTASKCYLVYKNAHGDIGRVKGYSDGSNINHFEVSADGLFTAEFRLPKQFTEYPGAAWLTIEAIDSIGRPTRFSPAKVKIADFIEGANPFSLDGDWIENDDRLSNEIYYDPIKKELVPSDDLITAFVKGDDRGRLITFILPRHLGGSGLISRGDAVVVQYKNAHEEAGEYLVPSHKIGFYSRDAWTLPDVWLHEGEGDDVCVIEFVVPASLTAYPGEAEIQINIKHPNGSVVNLSPAQLTIGPFFDRSEVEPSDPKYDIIDQIEASTARLESLITGDNTITLDGYLKKAEAASTYETIEDASYRFLGKKEAAAIYETSESASATYLTKAEAKRDYISRVEAYQLNAYHGYHAYGPSTFMLDASSVNEAVISFSCGYPTTVDVAFKGVGGATLATKTVPVDGTTYLSVFRVADAVAESDGRTIHYIYTKVGDSPATGPLDPSASATYASDSDCLAAIDFGQIPDRCQVDVVTR